MKRRAARSLLLFLGVLAVYLSNGRTIGAGDTLPSAYLPWSLLERHDFDLDEFPVLHDETARRIYPLLDGVPYYLQYRNGHYVSAYAPGAGVLATPIYAVPVLMGAAPDRQWPDRLEKLSAAIITALSVVVLYWALGHVTSRGWALGIALVYALGTSSFSVSSQGLWQHGPSQLFLALMLYALVRGLTDDRYFGYAGAPMSAAVLMRPTDLLIVLPVALWIACAHRRRIVSLALCSLPVAAAALYYVHVTHTGITDRGVGYTTAPLWAFFTQMPLREGLPGVLVSPSRGLFVYSPVLLFSIGGAVTVWRHGPAPWRALTIGPPLVVLLVSKWLTWWGGHSWGPRLLADLAPILCFLLYPVTPWLDRWQLAKVSFALLSVWSVLAHGLGAWVYDRRWDAVATDRLYAQLSHWEESPLAFYAREALFRLVPGPGPARDAAPATASELAASYRSGAAPVEVMSGERFVLPVSATNEGPHVWRAATRDDRGAVRLGWRWYRDGREIAAGRELLLADVPPGRSARFDARVTASVPPGEYTLVVGLVSEWVAWFGERGDRPMPFRVTVQPVDATRMLAGPLRSMPDPPRATIVTDRATYRAEQSLELAVRLEYPHHPRVFDGYLIFQRSDGRVLFFDGHEMPRSAGSVWPAWARNLPLPARATARFVLPASALAGDTYRCYVVLTEPGAYTPVTRAVTSFAVEP